jgi:argininosuccinate lyase
LKEQIIPAINDLKACLTLSELMLQKIQIKDHILEQPKYQLIFSVEVVNKLASEGMPFRDAYKKVAKDIEAGNFKPDTRLNHTHEGSLGNLCNQQIEQKFIAVFNQFRFDKIHAAIKKLIDG